MFFRLWKVRELAVVEEGWGSDEKIL